MNSLSSYSISTGAVAAGSIKSASVFTPNFVFFGGTLNELLFTPDGMKYRGEVVNDAGAAHAIIIEVLGGRLTKAQGACNDDENRVTVDRRDLHDCLRSAWRAGQEHVGELDEAERWAKATDHAESTMRSWSGVGEAPGQCAPVKETEHAGTGRLDYLADLAWRLVHALRKAAPGHALTATAMAYLQRHALQGSPLREDGAVGPFEPLALIKAVDVLQTTIDQVWIEAMQAASRLVIKKTGIPIDALRAGRGVRDRIVIEGEEIAQALRNLGRDTVTARPPSSAPSIHPSVWLDPAMNLLREARDSIVDFGPRGTQLEIIADIDQVLKRGVTA